MSWNYLSITFGIILLIPAPLRGQSTSTRLDGIVRDSSGNAIDRANISARDETTGSTAEVVTDARGYYAFPALGAGYYTVVAKADRFKSLTRSHVSLLAPGSVTENMVLQSGSPSETNEETRSGDPLPQTNALISWAYSRRELDGLPLVMRDPLALVAFGPGVQINGGKELDSTVNGARQNANVVTMDGLSVTHPTDPLLGFSLTPLSPEAIADVRIVSGGGSAEYGQASGGHVMLISRSGGPAWHGNFFDYFRPMKPNARDFFENSASFTDMDNEAINPKKSGLAQNIYGATISGPIQKNKTFVFGSYQGRTTNQQKLINTLVLTSTAKSGIFQWYKPRTTTDDDVQTFDIPGNDPRGIGIDPKVRAVLANMPDPNNITIGDQLNGEPMNFAGYLYNTPLDGGSDQATARVDHAWNNTHHLFARFNWNRYNAIDAPARYAGDTAGTQEGRNWGITAGSDWNLSSRTVNELRVGYQRVSLDLKRPQALSTASPVATFNTWTSADSSSPRSATYPISEVSDNLSFVRGNHLLKAGVMFRRTVLNSTDYSGVYPQATLGIDHGNQPSASVGPSVTSSISPADRLKFEYLYNDLLGRMEQITQTFNAGSQSYLPAGSPRARSYAYRNYGAFLQDDWKVLPNFTLSLGIRYELGSVPHELNGLGAALDQASQITSTTQLSNLAFVPGGAWYKRDMANFAPRVGFAWDISRTGRMVLRGSYGIFYDQLAGDMVNFVDQNTPAFSQQVTANPNAEGADVRLSEVQAPSSPASPILQPALSRANTVATFDQNLSTGRVKQFTLTLERRILGDIILEAGYAGSRANNLLMYLDLNQTKIEGDFLGAFNELRALRSEAIPVSASNTIAKVFGSPRAATDTIGGYNLDLGQTGVAAEITDREYYSKYAAAGVPDSYLRNFPQFDQFIYGTNTGRSWYDSLQLGVRKTGASYSVSARYLWSKSLDNISSAGSRFVAPADSFDPDSNKAPSDFDRSRVLSAMATWHLPSIGQGLLSGWDLGLIGIRETGQRFSVTSGLETAQSGYVTLADYSESRKTGQITKQGGKVFWFTADTINEFSRPAAGTRGTSGRNSFVGPGYYNLDASLTKSFRLAEGKSILFRAECVNVMNNTNFGVPKADLSDLTNFGRITTLAGSPRALQIAMKFQF